MDALDYLLVLTLIFVLFLLLRLSEIGARINLLFRIERKVDLLLKQAGLDYDPIRDAPQNVLDALKSTNKIEAIKRYREATGAGLRESKEFVEELQRSLRDQP